MTHNQNPAQARPPRKKPVKGLARQPSRGIHGPYDLVPAACLPSAAPGKASRLPNLEVRLQVDSGLQQHLFPNPFDQTQTIVAGGVRFGDQKAGVFDAQRRTAFS